MTDIDPYLLEKVTALFKAEWTKFASCSGLSDSMFFDRDEYGDLVELCEGCPVRLECLDDAIYFGDEGFRAGLTEEERNKVLLYRKRHRANFFSDVLDESQV